MWNHAGVKERTEYSTITDRTNPKGESVYQLSSTPPNSPFCQIVFKKQKAIQRIYHFKRQFIRILYEFKLKSTNFALFDLAL